MSEGNDAPERSRARNPMSTSILLVEDSPFMRSLLVQELRSRGYPVTAAANGLEALELVVTLATENVGQFDVVITDARMPGLSGPEFLAAIRAANVSAPVVLITALRDSEVEAQAMSFGAAAVIEKPFDLAHLVDTIEELASAAR